MHPTHLATRVILKSLILFVIANLLFAAFYPMDSLGRMTAYNRIFPGRARLPYGDNPEQAFNLSLYNLNAMFASHEITNPKPPDEFRIVLIGDSSTWGYLLPADQTLSAQLNQMNLTTSDDRKLRFYNLGYPVMSITKDLVILTYALQYEPDLIIWLLTLESLPRDKQLFPPLLQNNPEAVRSLIASYGLQLDPNDPGLHQLSMLERTLVGARRPLADLIRLQLYGVLWSATGIDQDIPETWDPPQSDLSDDLTFHDLLPPSLDPTDLALETLAAGQTAAGNIPVVLVNEPMFISRGINSDLRYNFYYPRWVYDDYRQILAETAAREDWAYLDAWNLVPETEFTNSAVHLTPAGTRLFAEWLAKALKPEVP